MTDKKDDTPQKKKGTLSLGGTLGVSGGANKASDGGIAIEVRKRRFSDNSAPQAQEKPADDETARRLKALEEAKKSAGENQQKREEARKQAEELQSKQAEALQEQKRREEAARAEAEIARMQAEENQRKAAQEEKKSAPSLAEQFKRGKTATKVQEKDYGKKRGRNAYLDDLEQRYRAMPGKRKAGQRADKTESTPAEKVIRDVELPDFITVQELASRMAEKGADVVKKLMLMGEMVTLTQTIDQETAILVVEEFGHKYHTVSESDIEEGLVDAEDDPAKLVERPPVVTVMGHVDHGKTTLLDSLRKTTVVAGEAGGITQHIGAYQVTSPSSGRQITFLDTPGHAAFTAMRARGAQVTDIVVLCVAADDGVMPQTIEAIQHAQAAGVPLVVAINKMDKPDANPQRVKNELLSHGLTLEEYGGDTPAVPISALNGDGLADLEEVILLQADMLELKANPERQADGIVVEAELDKGRGPVATVVVQRGTLNVGEHLVAGAVYGRVRALMNDKGENASSAGPSAPVEILGLQGVPAAGDTFVVVDDAERAREVAEWRAQKQREKQQASRKVSLDNLFENMGADETRELNIIVKADVQGSAEAITGSVKQLATKEVTVNVISSGVGVVTETDVTLAKASSAIIVAFNVRADATARRVAESDGVEVRYYNVIYNLIDELKDAMAGLLAPEYKEEQLGTANVIAVFKAGKKKVAGSLVTEGIVRKGEKCRLLRDGKVVYTGNVASLRREKDDVKEVASGTECGVLLEKFDDVQEGDTLEVFTLHAVKKSFDDLEKVKDEPAGDEKKA